MQNFINLRIPLPLWYSKHRWLGLILLVSLCINFVGIDWGLPNKNDSWATDSLHPVAPLAIVKRAFIDEEWNSGWFYFKYPLGHPFVLAAVQAPYMAWLWATGAFQEPTPTYPYGFRQPEHALTTLALLTRVISALMGVGVVGFAYAIAAMLFGTSAGVVAALLVTGSYPIVYFAHTANVDVPMLFWTALAVVSALVCADRDSTRAAAGAGLAAGVALFTKEQSIGMLVAVPLVWFVRRYSRGLPPWRDSLRYGATAGAGFLAMTVLLGNLWWNPAGFLNRWRFLLAILPPEIREKYAPYQFYLQGPTVYSLGSEGERLLEVADKVMQALTEPIAGLCVIGTVWACWRFPRQVIIPLLLAASYYMLSLRSLGGAGTVNVKYTIPLLYILLILGGAAGGACLERLCRVPYMALRSVAGLLVVAALGCALLPGIEIDRLIVNDPRYAAEAWLQARLPAGARVETYQSATRLPRFSPAVQVSQVPVEERTIELFEQRQPDFVVLSSGGRAGLTYRQVPNWQPGKPKFVQWELAREFFDRLRAEQLGYRRIAQFQTPTRWITPAFASVNPEILILARVKVSPY